MIATTLIAASICLQGGEQLDIARYVPPTANVLLPQVSIKPVSGGTLVVYSPGHEDQSAQFSAGESSDWILISLPVLCVKAIGGPFEFGIRIVAIEEIDRGPPPKQISP